MLNTLLFTVTVIIWGTTWIGIAAQVGEIPILSSIFLRFALAGLVMIVGLAAIGRLQRPPVWRFVVVQALCLFCFNFIGLYNATLYITSGLVSVIFSLVSIFNAVNGRIFFGDKITAQTLLAGTLGTIGLGLIFWPDSLAAIDSNTLLGIGWAVFGTLLFSLGNMASRRNSEFGIAAITANSWGMGIGALALLVMIVMSGQKVQFSSEPVYWGALVYLSIAGSIIGFTTYLVLAARIGSVRAGYSTVMFPIVALAISTLIEDYQWTAFAMIGVLLTILGNITMFWRPHLSNA